MAAPAGGHWHVRIQIFRNADERAKTLAAGLRAKGLKKGVGKSDSVVTYTRDVLDRYAHDSMSAAFFAMQQVWDHWPDDEQHPSSRFTCSVNYVPPKEDPS